MTMERMARTIEAALAVLAPARVRPAYRKISEQTRAPNSLHASASPPDHPVKEKNEG